MSSLMRRQSILSLAAALVFASGPAAANGRYPNADMLIVDPGDASHVVLRATFGTLVSNDGGVSWAWICEEAVGYMGDPALTVLAGGSLLHAFLGSITLSPDAACTPQALPFEAGDRVAVDVTLDALDPTRAWVLASGFEGRRQASVMEVSASDGVSAPQLVAEDFVPSTIEVSRSRPERLMVVGFDAEFQSTLLISDDRGQSWTPRRIGLYSTLPMYLSAIDPRDPDILYVRVDDPAEDHLIVSQDGGGTFFEALTLPGDMLGFALSPDGARVAVGGPGAGLYVAETSALSFAPAAPIESLRCLTWTQAGLFACAQESLDGWTLARSPDGAQRFEPLWHVQDLVPLACPQSTPVGNLCSRFWLDIASRIGADLVPGEPEPAPAPERRDSSCEFGPRSAPARASCAAALALAGSLLLRRRARQGRAPG